MATPSCLCAVPCMAGLLMPPRLPPFFRWSAVAELVPGKSKQQCFKRFKELRDMHKAKATKE